MFLFSIGNTDRLLVCGFFKSFISMIYTMNIDVTYTKKHILLEIIFKFTSTQSINFTDR